MTRNIKYFLFSLLCVAAFLMLRHWLDRKREQIQDIDIVRPDIYEDDAHLGTWAQKNDDTLITFRLKRDGSFSYGVAKVASKDSVKYAGKYLLMSAVADDGLQYPRLVAVSDHGDTVINHFIQMAHATKRNVDILILKTDSYSSDTAIRFYRVKQ